MGSEFGRFGPNRGKLQRTRIIYIGGTSAIFLAALIALLFVYGRETAEANKLSKVQRSEDDQLFLTVPVVVPESPVPQGAKLSQVKLKIVEWARTELPMGAERHVEDVSQLYAKVALPAEQPIVRANLSPTPVLGGVLEMISPGVRAITIDVDATSSVEGWAFPGAHVDLLVTYRDAEDGISKTRVAVEDAVVLSFNGQTQREETREAGGRVVPAATVTLAVPVQDTLKIRTAQAMGRISLILRSSDDVKGVGEKTFGADEWDENNKKLERNASADPLGFASYTDSNGVRKEFVLTRDKRWYPQD